MDTKISITLAAYAYFLLVGISYMWGYWLPFELNILAFADITDIIKASAYPLLPAVGMLVTYAALDGLNTISKKQHDDYVAEGGVFRAYMRFIVGFNFLIIAAALVVSAYQVIVEPGYGKLKGAFPLISLLAFCYLLFGNKHLLELDVRVRAFFLALVCFLPSAAFRAGNGAGNELKNLAGTYWTLSPKEPCPGSSGELVLLGKLSNKYLTMVKNEKSLCVIEGGNVQLIKTISRGGA
ncbi:hypothetical protein [Zoogloea dura]|uniref:Uncharacterized protein n=1 Tax=Zoogloea dura TaxID=2728840 RepID=A0A848GDT2_9RHOO|nr:hypothetical protein [Zoogloea dura]NML28945.1 hypothetical protein [Zoogloea dura]